MVSLTSLSLIVYRGGTSPSGKRIEDYDLAMVNAVRLSDLEALEQMCRDGKRYVSHN